MEIVKNVRDKVTRIMMGLNNIDRVMTDKVNDYILVEELPLPILIGNKTIYVGNFTLENDYKFWHMYGKLLAHVGIELVNFDMLADGAELYKVITTHKKWYKGMIKIISKTLLKQQGYFTNEKGDKKLIKWRNCSYRYFKKYITKEKLIQICYLIYLYNFDAVKKNFRIITSKMATGRQAMETYMYFWLQNCIGLTGAFQLAQLQNVIPLVDDMQNHKSTQKRKNQKQKRQDK